MIHDEHNNKIIPKYLLQCKKWHQLDLIPGIIEYVDTLENCLNTILKENEKILILAKKLNKVAKSRWANFGWTGHAVKYFE